MNKHHGGMAVSVAAGLLVLLLGATACSDDSGGPGVAGGGKQSSATPGGNAGGGDPVAYAKCMREHGLSNFPDPDANGAIVITGGPESGLNPNSAQFKAAQQACKSLEPKPAGGAQPDRNAAVQYAKCMREHGISKFPDPAPDGGIKLDGNTVDQNSPQFKAAASACAKYQPGGAGANQSTTGTGNAGG